MKILLCCNSGMSSSILVKKMKEYAEKNNIELEIKAIAYTGVGQEKGLWECCLVGPQMLYALEAIKKEAGCPTASIEPRSYALADGEAVIKLAQGLING